MRKSKRISVPLKPSKEPVVQGEVGVALLYVPKKGTVVSVAGVHQEVRKQTHVINKSEVYSHSLGLLFRCILALMAHWWGVGKDTTETSKVKIP